MSLDHAQLTEESSLPFEVQQNRLFCQNGYFLESPLSLYHSCAAKGMKDGFHYWFKVVRNKREKKIKLREIARESEVDRIVKKIWTEMLGRKNKGLDTIDGEIFIEGSKVKLPRGLFVPRPEGFILEATMEEGGAIITPHKRLEVTEQFRTKEKLFESYALQLERDDGMFQGSLPSDPEEKCQQNRIYLLHQAMKGQLEKCKGVAEFQQQGLIVLGNGEATLDELEYLNRLLLEISSMCGVARYANDLVINSLNNPNNSHAQYNMNYMHSLLI